MMNQYTCSGCGGSVSADPALKSSVPCPNCSTVLIFTPAEGASSFVDFQCPTCGVTNSADSAIEPEIRCSSCFGLIKLGQAQPAAAQGTAGVPDPDNPGAQASTESASLPAPAGADTSAQAATDSQPAPDAQTADSGTGNPVGAENPLPELGSAARNDMPQLGGAAGGGLPELGAAAKSDMPQLGGAAANQSAESAAAADNASAEDGNKPAIDEETGKDWMKSEPASDSMSGEETTDDQQSEDESDTGEEAQEEAREETTIELDEDGEASGKKGLPVWLKFFIDRPRLLIAMFGVVPVMGIVVTGAVLTFIRSGKALAAGGADMFTHGGAIVLGLISLWLMYNLVMNYYYADRDWITDLGNFLMIAGACWGMYAVVTTLPSTFTGILGHLFYAYVCLAAITLAIWLLAPYKGIGKPR